MVGMHVGAKPAEFCDEFFPPPLDSPTGRSVGRPQTNPFAELKDANTMPEGKITEKLIDAINGHNLAPGLKLRHSGDRPDPALIDPDGQKVDAAFFREANTPEDGKPHWVDQIIPVEFKRHDSHGTYLDPFHHCVSGFTTSKGEPDKRKRGRGQVITYAEFIMAIQQRVAVFMLVIVGRGCRFVRWDRSGSIVMELVDYYEQWELFCDILWRISTRSDVQLGCDPTAVRVLPGDEDYHKMDLAAVSRPTDIDHTVTDRPLRAGEIPDTSPGPDGQPKPTVFKYVRAQFFDSINAGWPRYCLSIPDGKETRNFLVSKPSFRATGLIGRATRGYVALDCDTGRFVWLKDAWRAHYLKVEQEGAVLKQLNNGNVPFVPTLVCHGDVEEQDTLTPAWWERQHAAAQPTPSKVDATPVDASARPQPSSTSSSKRKRCVEDDEEDVPRPDGLPPSTHTLGSTCPLRRHRHYRLVVQEVALPLSEFQHGRQLVEVVRDCVIAHSKAFELGIMHRDISGGNILILPIVVKVQSGVFIVCTGVLADWEMSKPITTDDEPGGPRQPERTATWQFMSVAILNHPGTKTVEVCDELEAYFYVVLYYAIRYMKSSFDNVTIATFLDEFFDCHTFVNGKYACGATKSKAIETGQLSAGGMKVELDGPMDSLVKTLLCWFSANYHVKLYKDPSSSITTASRSTSPAAPPAPQPHNEDAPGPSATALLRPFVSRHSRGASKVTNMPTAEQFADAKAVADHTEMISLLDDASLLTTWSRKDKVGDQVPANWRVEDNKTFAQTLESIPEEGSNKRPRLSPEIQAPLVVPPRPPVTPPPRGQTEQLEGNAPELEE
ncbi:hypothetical protein C8Q80DRAFT_1200653 [Daedaleopsis nitida]|nr:hypothetical protein C8Q80DRAFT_1200653 [Daedaleopsis nitida]